MRGARRDLVGHNSDTVHSEEKVDFLMVFGSLNMIELVLFTFVACHLTLSCEMTQWGFVRVTFQALGMEQCARVGVSN